MNSDLKLIKKKYGERMSHLCRELFPIILEQEGLLPKLLLDHFEPNHFLYEDIVKNGVVNSFKNYLYQLIDNKQEETQESVTKTPKELLSEAGYDLYECHSEEDIEKFKKYYASNERLCTFKGGRLNDCYVFFAVKKNVDQIRREDFDVPRRQDEYGTSVISIQFERDDSHTLSIKNRYNHRVENPDATFSNNLDNIVPGLTDSFSQYYGLEQKYQNKYSFEIPGYVQANDGKFYPYNVEISNIYYCPNNIIIDDFEVKKYDKDKYLLFDYFLLNIEKKEIIIDSYLEDSFFELCSSIERIEIEKQESNKIVKIYDQKSGLTEMVLNNKSAIKKVKNDNVQVIEENFLHNSRDIEEISLSKAEQIKDGFLSSAKKTMIVFLPQAQYIGKHFLEENETIQILSLPKAKIIKRGFLPFNDTLRTIDAPEVEVIEDFFLNNNNTMKEISLPKAKTIGYGFMSQNNQFKKVYFPNAETFGSHFLNQNNSVEEMILPKAKSIGTHFLESNRKLKKLVFSKELEEKLGRLLDPDLDRTMMEALKVK